MTGVSLVDSKLVEHPVVLRDFGMLCSVQNGGPSRASSWLEAEEQTTEETDCATISSQRQLATCHIQEQEGAERNSQTVECCSREREEGNAR